MNVLVESDPCTQDAEGLEAGLRRLLGLANDLCESVRAGCGRGCAERHVARLLEFMREQFACEERMLEQAHYAGLAVQRHEHQNLVEWLEQMQKRLEAGTLPASESEIAGYLRDWLSEHIHRSDQSYLSELGCHESW